MVGGVQGEEGLSIKQVQIEEAAHGIDGCGGREHLCVCVCVCVCVCACVCV